MSTKTTTPAVEAVLELRKRFASNGQRTLARMIKNVDFFTYTNQRDAKIARKLSLQSIYGLIRRFDKNGKVLSNATTRTTTPAPAVSVAPVSHRSC